jgi:uncharacterized membrane protein
MMEWQLVVGMIEGNNDAVVKNANRNYVYFLSTILTNWYRPEIMSQGYLYEYDNIDL